MFQYMASIQKPMFYFYMKLESMFLKVKTYPVLFMETTTIPNGRGIRQTVTKISFQIQSNRTMDTLTPCVIF